jgi:hypothetical protein
MGLFSLIFGPHPPRAANFSFMDGRVITAQELGAFSANQFVIKPSMNLLQELFGAPELGEPLSFARAVNAAPDVALFYVLAFYIGIYRAYVQDILHVNDETISAFDTGIRNAINGMRTSQGEPLPEEMRSSIIGAGKSFCNAVIADMKTAAEKDPRVVRSLLSNRTSRLLLSFIGQAYTKPRPAPSDLLEGIGLQHMARIDWLDRVPLGTLTFLRDELRIRIA